MEAVRTMSGAVELWQRMVEEVAVRLKRKIKKGSQDIVTGLRRQL
jgi:hypothetical protein